MIGKRGIRKVSTRVRLAVAAAVLVGGGAATVVGVAASHNTTATAQSAGYYMPSGRTMGETTAVSEAMNGWSTNSFRSMQVLTHMQPMNSFSLVAFHTHTIALQRGIVVAESIRAKEIAVQSFNGRVEVWHWNNNTKAVNVGGSSTGWDAMTGGSSSMSMPSSWHGHLNFKSKTAVPGDLVFIIGQRVKGQLIAQVVLFAAPLKITAPAPTAMPTATVVPTAIPTATSTWPATTPTSAPAGLQPTHS
jgi:hypothetical protein